MENYKKNYDEHHCTECGAINKKSAYICQDCGKKINKRHLPVMDFLKTHIKNDAKETAVETVFGLLRRFLFSHLYGTILTVSIVAAVTVSAVTATPYIKELDKESNQTIVEKTLPDQQETPEPEPEVVEEVLSKETPIFDFIGKTVGEMKQIWGEYDMDEGYGGLSALMYFDEGITFYTPHTFNMTDNEQIVSVSSATSVEVFEGLSGNETFDEIQQKLPDLNLKVPERSYNEMDGEWQYTLEFQHKGRSVEYLWYDEPTTNKSAYIYIQYP